jgi:sodium-dependent dicarboxylate transporter 2/3/5
VVLTGVLLQSARTFREQRLAIERKDLRRYLILAIALLVFLLVLVLPNPQGLTTEGRQSIAIFLLCVILWVTSVIPLMITSLLSIILFPILGIFDAPKAFSLFGNEAAFFILGAFILASGLLRSGLSSRIALLVLARAGATPTRLLVAIFGIGCIFSFFMSEHAVAAMLFPIVVEIAAALRLEMPASGYGKALFLALAWGCVIGGIGTLLGGARAALAISILERQTGRSIGFLGWGAAALPAVIVIAPLALLMLVRIFRFEIDDVAPAARVLEKQIRALGPISRREKAFAVLLGASVVAWAIFGPSRLAMVALGAVAVGFVFDLLKWSEVNEDVNWGVFLMYGGAIGLGFAMDQTGAARWFLDHVLLASGGMSAGGMVLLLSLVSIVLTAFMSNSAVVALLMPVAIAFAGENGLDPATLTLAIAVPSGLAFILPMGTPACAIAFSSGYLRITDTVRAGLLLTGISWLVLNGIARVVWPMIGFKV